MEARQSFRDHPAFVALVVSLALIVLFIGFALGEVLEKRSILQTIKRAFLKSRQLSRVLARFKRAANFCY